MISCSRGSWDSIDASVPAGCADVAGFPNGCYTRDTNYEAYQLGSKLAQQLPARRARGHRPRRLSLSQGCDRGSAYDSSRVACIHEHGGYAYLRSARLTEP